MKAILLESEVFEIKSIKKQTQAKIFKDMIVGDKVQFSIEIKESGFSISGSRRASYIRCTNLNTYQSVYKSFNELPKIIKCFELVKFNKHIH